MSYRIELNEELREELKEAESAWLERMAPKWREESEEVLDLDRRARNPSKPIEIIEKSVIIP